MHCMLGFHMQEIAGDDREQKHFLDACARCNKSLKPNRDIYMYRGNVPFCSKECRLEQIITDEAAERSRRRRSLRAIASAEQKHSSGPAKSSEIRTRPERTVVVS